MPPALLSVLLLAAVADFAVLRPDPATGLRAHRDFRAGEAYADYQRQLAGIAKWQEDTYATTNKGFGVRPQACSTRAQSKRSARNFAMVRN